MKKLFMHSDKAIRNGYPDNRVFAVHCVSCGFNIAWKHWLTKDGKIAHTGYELVTTMEDDDPRLYAASSPSGSEPTAMFKLDSFYEPFSRAKMLSRIR